MTAIKAEPSRELADKIGKDLACTRTYTMQEWAVIEAALRAPAGDTGVREAPNVNSILWVCEELAYWIDSAENSMHSDDDDRARVTEGRAAIAAVLAPREAEPVGPARDEGDVRRKRLENIAFTLVGIQEDLSSESDRETLGFAAHYLREYAALAREAEPVELRSSPGSETLLPCPFCGEAPAVEMTGFHLGARTIYCAGNDCMGPSTTAQNMDDATVQWNRRCGVAQAAPEPALVGLLTEVDPGLADALRENGGYVQVIRRNVIEECARSLERSYPDHAWLNAACAAVRSLSVPSTEGK